MNASCPISEKRLNQNAARTNAVLVIISLFILLNTPHKWIIFILGIDFFMRGFGNPSLSILNSTSKIILRVLKFKPLMVDAAPKIFAAKTGFLFCAFITAFYLLNMAVLMNIFIIVFMSFASLEAFFGFCAVCKLYPFISKIKNIK